MVPEHPRDNDYRRDKHERQKRHLPADDKHHDQRDDHCHKRRKHVAEHLFHKLPDLLRVVGNTVHKLSRTPVVDKRQGQHLNLIVQLLPQAHADIGAQLRAVPIAQDVQRKPCHQQHKGNDDEGPELLHRSVTVGQRVIDELLLYHRGHKLDRRDQQQHHGDQQQSSDELSAERHKFFQGIRLAVTIRAMACSRQRASAFFTVLLVFPAGDAIFFGKLSALRPSRDDGLCSSCDIGNAGDVLHREPCRTRGAAVLAEHCQDAAVDLMLAFYLFAVSKLVLSRFAAALQHDQPLLRHNDPCRLGIGCLCAFPAVIEPQIDRHAVPDSLSVPQRERPLLRLLQRI